MRCKIQALIFEDLNDNVKLYHEQNALNLLLGEINKKNVDFYPNEIHKLIFLYQFLKVVIEDF